MAKRHRSSKTKRFFLALVLALAVISLWRGLWGVMDAFLFPDNMPLSYLASLCIGIFLLYFTHHRIEEAVIA